jgi:rfaE bifunctional protein nucleotidyltransferase chain/domain
LVFTDKIEAKVLSQDELLKRIEFWRRMGDRIVFTNGCFDILHQGHIYLLAACSELGDRLIIGLNSDASVKQIKGVARPINTQQSRGLVLAALTVTDAITIFNESTPEKLIEAVKPDVLVKGGDWKREQIAGAAFVEAYGGEVKIIPFLNGFSTTQTIEKLKQQ